jgi:mono/diheme cytochrome c family protein
MNYPFWDAGIGYGLLMAGLAVVHVFISHFAIGGGLFLVVAEVVARRRNDEAMLRFLRRLSKFFVMVSVVAGALTGVGIWFIVGLLNPTATEVLIHNFVWGWAIEWAFFIIEICAAIIYFYGWDRMSARDHIRVGWVYFGSAWLSLVVITGIITFMLTPGRWLETGAFWDGFLNPTYWSSVVLRTGICVMLAGLYAMLVAARMSPSDAARSRITRHNAVWGLVGLGITLPSFYWYYRAIPADIIERAQSMFWPEASLLQSYKYAVVIALLLLVCGIIMPRWNRTATALLLMVSGLAWFGSYEWFRESVRKPYVIEGYLYGNSLEVAKTDQYLKDGYLAHMTFKTGDASADLYRHICASCHTLGGGYRDLEDAFQGMDVDFIAGIVQHVDMLVPEMPPFLGNETEAAQLAAYIHARVDQRHLSEIHDLEGVPLGEQVYLSRCGTCHQLGGATDKWEVLAGWEAEDYSDFLDMAGEIAEEMPPFTGDDVERDALVDYFQSLNERSTDGPAGL